MTLPRTVAAACLSLVVTGLVAVPAGAGDGIGPRPTCTLSGTTLTVDPQGWVVNVARDGSAIVVRFPEGGVDCPGTPTVFNVDLVRVTQSEATFDLRRGLLEPGATDEGDGSSEIEIEIESEFGAQLRLRLGNRADHVRVGTIAPGRAGIDLDADDSDPDVDVTFHQSRDAMVEIDAGGGDDRVTADGGGAFAAPLHGPLTHLDGEKGRDHVTGSPRVDVLVGGPGADLLRGLAGSDGIGAFRDGRDRVRCGPGRSDTATNDRRDILRGCEFPNQQ
jgi:hypothetical protein